MIETFINGEGKPVKIEIGEDCHPNSLGKDICCLTCGTYAKERKELLAITVGCAEGMKEWLSERMHYVQPEHSILLCEPCFDEFEEGELAS